MTGSYAAVSRPTPGSAISCDADSDDQRGELRVQVVNLGLQDLR